MLLPASYRFFFLNLEWKYGYKLNADVVWQVYARSTVFYTVYDLIRKRIYQLVEIFGLQEGGGETFLFFSLLLKVTKKSFGNTELFLILFFSSEGSYYVK